MSNVVKFEAHGKKYDLSVIDNDGQKWITSQQLGEALGAKNIRRRIQRLIQDGELREGKHFSSIRLQKTSRGNPNALVLSSRGVVRVSMAAQSSRAKLFRDWMEDVLVEVMATGSYQTPADKADTEYVLAVARRDAMMRGLLLSDILRDYNRDAIAKAIHFRRMGLTQKETGGALGLSKDKIKRLEARLRDVGVHFDPVPVNARNKQLKEKVFDNLIPFPERPEMAVEAIQ